MSFNIM